MEVTTMTPHEFIGFVDVNRSIVRLKRAGIRIGLDQPTRNTLTDLVNRYHGRLQYNPATKEPNEVGTSRLARYLDEGRLYPFELEAGYIDASRLRRAVLQSVQTGNGDPNWNPKVIACEQLAIALGKELMAALDGEKADQITGVV